MSVTEAKTNLARQVVRSMRDGDGCMLESDTDVNDASRDVIETMQAEHGQAWLGKINLYGKERHGNHPFMWQWDGGMVYNFGADFVAPVR